MQQRTDNNKGERLQIRVDKRSKNLLQKASTYSHKKVTDFVLGYALAAAETIVKEHEQNHLSEKDWILFYNALTTPPKPNAKLKSSMAKYKKLTGK